MPKYPFLNAENHFPWATDDNPGICRLCGSNIANHPLQKHRFRGSVAMGCFEAGCGRGFTDDIHLINPSIFIPSSTPSVDDLPKTDFENMLDSMVETLAPYFLLQDERARTETIARIVCSLISFHGYQGNVTMENAIHIYNEIKKQVIKR